MSALEMRILADTAAHRAAVSAVIMASGDYSLLIEGGPPRAEEVADFFEGLPPGRMMSDKYYLGFFVDNRLAGIADFIRGWNAPNKAIIGLLLFAPEYRQAGRGRESLAQIEALARSWPGVDTLRIAVIDTNGPAFAFWHRMGFAETGESRPVEAPFIGAKIVLEKNMVGTEHT